MSPSNRHRCEEQRKPKLLLFFSSPQTPHYSLTVQAADEGDPPLSSAVLITISVADVNDNPPVFSRVNHSLMLQVRLTCTSASPFTAGAGKTWLPGEVLSEEQQQEVDLTLETLTFKLPVFFFSIYFQLNGSFTSHKNVSSH